MELSKGFDFLRVPGFEVSALVLELDLGAVDVLGFSLSLTSGIFTNLFNFERIIVKTLLTRITRDSLLVFEPTNEERTSIHVPSCIYSQTENDFESISLISFVIKAQVIRYLLRICEGHET